MLSQYRTPYAISVLHTICYLSTTICHLSTAHHMLTQYCTPPSAIRCLSTAHRRHAEPDSAIRYASTGHRVAPE
eukprot:976445-Rhodomonas_salina.6